MEKQCCPDITPLNVRDAFHLNVWFKGLFIADLSSSRASAYLPIILLLYEWVKTITG